MSDSWLDSIVLVVSRDEAITDFGTGFLIYRDERATYFVTCAHVVNDVGGADNIAVSVRERKEGGTTFKDYQAGLVACGSRDTIDLAVLRVEGRQILSLLPLRSTSPEKNTPFYTAGYRLFERRRFEFRRLQG